MFEAIKNDPAIFEITIILLILVGVAIWQNLNRAAMVMGGVYIFYLLFISFKSATPTITDDIKKLQERKFSALDTSKQHNTMIIEENETRGDTHSSEEIIAETSPVKQTTTIEEKENQIVDQALDNVIQENPMELLMIALGTNVVNRRIENPDSLFSFNVEKIYCLTGIRNQNDSNTIFHKWYQGGILRSKITLEMGRSYNWRTWSYITVNKHRVGNWKVVVEDALGVRYDSLSFQITNNLKD